MITPSICKLQKKFEQENNICKIIQNTFLSVRIKIDNSKNKFFYDNIELVINDEGVGYSVMTSIELSDSLEFNASATKLLNELNQIILPTSNPNYTPCDITIANRIPQIAIISKVIEKIDADEQDINNLYAECLSLCDLSLSFIETLQKRLESNESKIQESTSGCYIATSVYGSYDCPQVWTLRRYRDYNLSNTWCGRLFISIYYMISPILVKRFGKTTWFKQFWKRNLDKMVKHLNSQGFEDTPYEDASCSFNKINI